MTQLESDILPQGGAIANAGLHIGDYRRNRSFAGWKDRMDPREQAICLGLSDDAALSAPPESDAEWDQFMAFVRAQRAAVTVTKRQG